MNAYTQRLRRIEESAGVLPATIEEMTDAQLMRVIVGGKCVLQITDAELGHLANEPGLTHGRD